jgi:glycosyltransferase involved in cell wall biosynthesis
MSVLEPCTEAARSGEANRLDRAKWHRPLVSIIVTHFNFSTHVRDALLSLLDQTHENWECVIVDDGSEREHRLGVEAIINDIGSGKIRLLALEENRGQIPAFFAGLDATSGNFVCLLDPDDRYAETFLADALAAHLNDTLFCPILCCDQQLVQNDTVITGSNTWHKMRFLSWQAGNMAPVPQGATERLLFFPPNAKGWLWTSTSSLMFRRSAVNLMRPNKPLAYKRAADSYLAQGAHLLGGTLFLTKPLIYRRVHPGNSWLNQELFFTCQENGQPNLVNRTSECLVDVIEAIQHNGGAAQLKRNGVLE